MTKMKPAVEENSQLETSSRRRPTPRCCAGTCGSGSNRFQWPLPCPEPDVPVQTSAFVSGHA
jgi:hypothetical protein